MTVHQLVSASAEETYALGERLGALLQPGDFVGLVGGLGAGKTQLVRGIAAGAEVPPSEVSSPTFAIVQPYQGRLLLYHADLYRLADERELFGTGFYDLLDGSAAVLVEWLDRIPAAAPDDYLRLQLQARGEAERAIEVEAFGPRARALREQWLEP